MRSLFAKIFLSFWLVVLLMGGALSLVEQALGRDQLSRMNGQMEAHAETLATLLSGQGMEGVEKWLAGMSRNEQFKFFLLDKQRRPVADRHLSDHLSRALAEKEEEGYEPGINWIRPDLAVLVHEVPEHIPPLYLAAVAPLHRLARLPPWVHVTLAVLISGLVCFALAALLSRSVRRLRNAVQSFAAGDLEVRVGATGGDEVAALGRDFDLMAARLRDLLASQHHLLRDVSHELRSPLARLRVVLELARRRGVEEGDLNRIDLELDRLESLVSDLLTMARIEAGQSVSERRLLDLATLLAEIASDAGFEARARDKEVVLTISSHPQVAGMPLLLRAAVENVVRNAIRHTPPTTAVVIGLATENEQAVITVRDHGSGVPEKERERIFEPFARVGEARERERGGVGLGLAISRQVMVFHRGSIDAENMPEGGLRVTLRLPLSGESGERE